jgi:hypothetical protein
MREMRECGGRIEDASKVFDEMPMRTVLKNMKVLLLGEASRVRDAVRADVATACRENTRGAGGAAVRRL